MFTRLIVVLMCMLLCSPSSMACENSDACIEQNTWRFGVAMGLGARTNPLVDGDTIPLVVLPDIAWYGKNAYFDNGELGYQWQLNDTVSTEVFVIANRERANFSFWHPANIFVGTRAVAADGPAPPAGFPSEPDSGEINDPRYISVDYISRRKWSIDAGARVSWFDESTTLSLSVAHDALSVHKGYWASLRYAYEWRFNSWYLASNVAVTYKSSQLIDYYYGIDGADTNTSSLWYDAPHAIEVSTGLLLSKPINDRWRWIGRLQITSLGKGMADSPLVSKRYVGSAFFGLAYRF